MVLSPYKKQILLTNDDGIASPGLWAAAQALSALGFVHVVAPRDQYSGAGRSLPSTSDCIITVQEVVVNNQSWTVHSVGGSPAQAVQHAILEILPQPPDLVVSGINYGENVGSGITISGTVGAALEGAAFGIPSLAASLEVDSKYHFFPSDTVDFTVAAFFTTFFADRLLNRRFPPDVDVLKVDIPSEATAQTPWKVTRVSRQRYYEVSRPSRTDWSVAGKPIYHRAPMDPNRPENTDAYAINVERMVSVTPVSLDMTSRVDFQSLDEFLRE